MKNSYPNCSLLGQKEQIAPILDYFVRDNKMLIDVYLKTTDHSAKAREWVRDWSSRDLEVNCPFWWSDKI